jgi:flagellar biosynthetic protein FlhB
MSEEQPSQEDKTEEPSDKRRKDSRDKGEVAKSQELASAIMLLSGTLALWITLTYVQKPMLNHMSHIWVNSWQMEGVVEHPGGLMAVILWPVMVLLTPVFAVLVAMAIFTHMIQIGPLLSWQALKPNPAKLNPIKGIQRIFFSKDMLVNLVKTVVKVLLIGGVAVAVLRVEAGKLTRLVWMGPEQFARYLETISMVPLLICGVVMLLVGFADFVWQRYRMEEKMKMTRQEAKREHKESEGDPLQKGVRKQRHRELMSLNRLIVEVPEADVVLNNPTHYSVALRYRPEDGAPVVVAKGVDFKALRIREIAEEAGVAMLTNPPLARALHNQVAEGEAIPPMFYQAVAEVLAFVLQERRAAGKR